MLAEADSQLTTATMTQKAKKTLEGQLRKQHEDAEKQLREAREDYRENKTQVDQAQRDVARLERDCGLTYHELAEPFRSQVSATPPADWGAPGFPQESDLETLRRQTRELDGVKKALCDAEDLLHKWNQAKAREGTVQQNLTRVQAELPKDRESLRRRSRPPGDGDEKTFDNTLYPPAAARPTKYNSKTRVDPAARENTTLHSRRQQCAPLRGGHAQTVSTHPGADAARTTGTWRPKAERAGMTELSLLKQEAENLTHKQTDERAGQTPAGSGGAGFAQARSRNAGKTAGAIFRASPATGVGDSDPIEDGTANVRTVCEQQLAAKQHRKEELEKQHQKRQELHGQFLQTEQEFTESKLLADLLARSFAVASGAAGGTASGRFRQLRAGSTVGRPVAVAVGGRGGRRGQHRQGVGTGSA